jgi:hypothetical protein
MKPNDCCAIERAVSYFLLNASRRVEDDSIVGCDYADLFDLVKHACEEVDAGNGNDNEPSDLEDGGAQIHDSVVLCRPAKANLAISDNRP